MAHAHSNLGLGLLLSVKRTDSDAAEKAYRAAIEADPGYAKARTSLGTTLRARAIEMEKRGSIKKAAAIYQEVVTLWFDTLGPDNECSKKAAADLARVAS